MSYNFGNVEAKTISASSRIPEGDYLVKVIDTREGTSDVKGTPYVEVTVRIVKTINFYADDESNPPANPAGEDHKDSWYLTPGTAPYVKGKLEAFGIDASGVVNFAQLRGREAVAVMRLQANNQKLDENGSARKFIQVLAYNAAPASERDPVGGAAPQFDSDVPFDCSII